MRIWDISPGYLSHQKLQEEHEAIRELSSGRGQDAETQAADAETMRWMKYDSALARRHRTVLAEMHLRGGAGPCSPSCLQGEVRWPAAFLLPPLAQYALLRAEYQNQSPGRIPLPGNAQALWAQHKYSVMARDPAIYRAIGKRVSRLRGGDFGTLAEELVLILQETPPPGRLVNALEHMWGYVADRATADERRIARSAPSALLGRTIELAIRLQEPYLLASTALSDLAVFVDPPGKNDSSESC